MIYIVISKFVKEERVVLHTIQVDENLTIRQVQAITQTLCECNVEHSLGVRFIKYNRFISCFDINATLKKYFPETSLIEYVIYDDNGRHPIKGSAKPYRVLKLSGNDITDLLYLSYALPLSRTFNYQNANFNDNINNNANFNDNINNLESLLLPFRNNTNIDLTVYPIANAELQKSCNYKISTQYIPGQHKINIQFHGFCDDTSKIALLNAMPIEFSLITAFSGIPIIAINEIVPSITLTLKDLYNLHQYIKPDEQNILRINELPGVHFKVNKHLTQTKKSSKTPEPAKKNQREEIFSFSLENDQETGKLRKVPNDSLNPDLVVEALTIIHRQHLGTLEICDISLPYWYLSSLKNHVPKLMHLISPQHDLFIEGDTYGQFYYSATLAGDNPKCVFQLNNSRPNRFSCEYVANLLAHLPPTLEKTIEIQCMENMFASAQFFDVVLQDKNITALIIRHCQMVHQVFDALPSLLQQNTKIISLQLSDQPLPSNVVTILDRNKKLPKIIEITKELHSGIAAFEKQIAELINSKDSSDSNVKINYSILISQIFPLVEKYKACTGFMTNLWKTDIGWFADVDTAYITSIELIAIRKSLDNLFQICLEIIKTNLSAFREDFVTQCASQLSNMRTYNLIKLKYRSNLSAETTQLSQIMLSMQLIPDNWLLAVFDFYRLCVNINETNIQTSLDLANAIRDLNPAKSLEISQYFAQRYIAVLQHLSAIGFRMTKDEFKRCFDLAKLCSAQLKLKYVHIIMRNYVLLIIQDDYKTSWLAKMGFSMQMDPAILRTLLDQGLNDSEKLIEAISKLIQFNDILFPDYDLYSYQIWELYRFAIDAHGEIKPQLLAEKQKQEAAKRENIRSAFLKSQDPAILEEDDALNKELDEAGYVPLKKVSQFRHFIHGQPVTKPEDILKPPTSSSNDENPSAAPGYRQR